MISCDCKIENVYAKYRDEVIDVNMHWCALHGAAADLLEACEVLLSDRPLSVAVVTARAAVAKAKGRDS